jgi:PAS domain S-box-containing protein
MSAAERFLPFIDCDTEMASHIRLFDWTKTPLGHPCSWPLGLQTALNLLMHSRFPMFIWWGRELITLYNDAYIPIAGEKHPHLLGMPGKQAWAEIWNTVSPMVDQVMVGGQSTWAEDLLLYVDRYGYVEECYFTFSHSPLFDDFGNVAGVFCVCTETTDKVRAAKRLQANEANLRNLVKQSPAAMCILGGPSFVVEVANERMLELWGKKEADMLRRPVFEGLPEARNQGLEALLRSVYETGERFVASERAVALPRPHGIENVFVNFTYEPYFGLEEEVAGVMVVAVDVTDQVNARHVIEQSELRLQARVSEKTEALEVNQSLLHSILNASINGIIAMDAVRDAKGDVIDFRFVKANAQAAAHIGVDDASIGQSYLAHFPNAQTAGIFEKYCRVLTTGEPLRFKMHSTLESVPAWFEISIVPRKPDGIVATFADITAQRQADAQIAKQKALLDSILRHSPVGITVYRAIRDSSRQIIDFDCVLANDAAEAFTGVTAAERIGSTVLQLTPSLRDSDLFRDAVAVVETGQSMRSEYQNDQLGKWLELTVVKMYDDHLMNVFRDITVIKKTQAQHERTIEELSRSNAELEQFAYVASHDLQEPIRKILFFNSRSISAAGQNEKLLPLLGKVDESARRLQGIIRSLLEYSRLSGTGRRFLPVDLNTVLQNVRSDFEVLLTEKGAILEADELPVIEGNELQLNQLFFNLIGNALKFTKKNRPPVIRVMSRLLSGKEVQGFTPLTPGKAYLELKFQDNGIGFQQEYAAKIFEVFQRLNDQSAFGGYGIGLSICKKVADAHQGHIYATGTPQEGATFTVLLPDAQEHQTQ